MNKFEGKNIYSEPEVFGLTIIASLDEPDLSYSYNTLLVFVHKDSGRLFWAHDSGCSCPLPFEYFIFNSPDDNNMTEITNASITQFEQIVDGFPCPLALKRDLLFKECFFGYK